MTRPCATSSRRSNRSSPTTREWAGKDSNLRPTDYEFHRKASREFVSARTVRSSSILSREFGGVGDKVREKVSAATLTAPEGPKVSSTVDQAEHKDTLGVRPRR